MLVRDLSASIGFHFGLAFLAVSWSPLISSSKFDDPLPVEIITIAEFTRAIEAARRKAKDKVKNPVRESKSQSVPISARQVVRPPPGDAMPLQKTASTQATAKPKQRPRQRPVSPKSKLNLSDVRALLNKTPDTALVEKPTLSALETAEEVTVSEIDAFRIQMKRCWSPPVGAHDAAALVVKVRLSLTPDGKILSGPVVVNRGQLGNSFFRAAAESVLRAIRRCQPFDMPFEKYAAWRDIELIFDPSKMLIH